MMYKIILSIALTVISAQAAFAQGQLNDFLLRSAENNPELQRAYFEYQAALERMPQQKALPDPQLGIGFYILPVETRVGPRILDLSLSQRFPWFGTLAARESAAEEMAKARLQAFEAERYRFFYEVKSIWYQVFLAQKRIELTREHLEILRTIEEITIAKFSAALVGMVEVLRVKMMINDMEIRLQNLQEQQETLRRQLNLLANQPQDQQVSTPSTVEAETVAFSRDALGDTILARNPELAALDREIAAAEQNIRLSELQRRPGFTIGIDYGMITPRQESGMEIPDNGKDVLMPMISMNIPINSNKYSAATREAEFRVNALEQSRQERENRLLSEMEEAYQTYQNAQREIGLYREQIKLAEKAYEILLAEYSADMEEIEEVLRMRQRILDYQIQLYEAIVENNTTVARLEMLYAQNLQ